MYDEPSGTKQSRCTVVCLNLTANKLTLQFGLVTDELHSR